MSHFCLLVILPHAVESDDAPSHLESVLEPFNEQPDDAPERETSCECGDWALIRAMNDASFAKFGHIEKDRKAHWADPEVVRRQQRLRDLADVEGSDEEQMRISDELGAIWKARISERLAFEEAFKVANARLNTPQADCEDCHGSGCRTTSYPEKRFDDTGALIGGPKWDWWQIGGRWTGLLSGYDPSKDPANAETCFHCRGSGRRDGVTTDGTCNGCGGKGVRTKWPTEWAGHAGDIGTVQQVLDDPKKMPFAILTPDGRWCEKGQMGWFGCVSNEKDKTEWCEQAESLLQNYADRRCVVVDCHI